VIAYHSIDDINAIKFIHILSVCDIGTQTIHCSTKTMDNLFALDASYGSLKENFQHNEGNNRTSVGNGLFAI